MTAESPVVFHPGAAKFGNFINYYEFHPPDARLKHIPKTLLSDLNIKQENKILALDVGCNAGNLTWELYRHLTKTDDNIDMDLHILAIDLDKDLITRCNESNPFPDNITFKHLDIMDADSTQTINNYLSAHSTQKFDIIFAFSITMWIHINHGDKGLFSFLKFITERTCNLLIEPQPWKCYRAADRRMKRCKHECIQLNNLKLNEGVDKFIEDYLVKDCSMVKIQQLGMTDWQRPILHFQTR